MNEKQGMSLTGTLMIVFVLAVVALLAWAIYSGPQRDPTEPVTVNVQQSVNINQQFAMPTMAPMPTQAPAYAPINDALSVPEPGSAAKLHNKTRRVQP